MSAIVGYPAWDAGGSVVFDGVAGGDFLVRGTGVPFGMCRSLAGALAPDLCGGLDEGAELILFVLG